MSDEKADKLERLYCDLADTCVRVMKDLGHHEGFEPSSLHPDQVENCLRRVTRERDAALLQVEEERKLKQGYYSEAAEGWKKFRAIELQIRDLKEAAEAALAFLQFDQPNNKSSVGDVISKLVNASNAVAAKPKCEECGCPPGNCSAKCGCVLCFAKKRKCEHVADPAATGFAHAKCKTCGEYYERA